MWQGLERLRFQLAVSIPLLGALLSPVFAADPFASNNGLYPDQSQWQGTYRSLNYDYPETAENKWFAVAPRAPLTIKNADEYVAALKAFVEPSMKGMIDETDTWDPSANGWYGMI